MRKAALLTLVVTTLFSCKNTWDNETKQMFNQSCLEEANNWAQTPEEANAYCDCVLGKIMKKYPHMDDALEHVDSIMVDQNLKNCRQETRR
jgi:hypothetical protein